jgi:hypothetical protein
MVKRLIVLPPVASAVVIIVLPVILVSHPVHHVQEKGWELAVVDILAKIIIDVNQVGLRKVVKFME